MQIELQKIEMQTTIKK